MERLLDTEAQRAFDTDAKVGLLATRDRQGRPHLSLITSLSANGPRELAFGQFTEGLSKKHLRNDPRLGFLVMTQERKLWRGTARWIGCEQSGDLLERFNRRPMFRYNAYFGIHTVHRLELLEVSRPERFPLGAMLTGVLKLSLLGALMKKGQRPALNIWTQRHLAALHTIKFLSWVHGDGFSRIVPAIPCRPVGRGRLLLAPSVFKAELRALPLGTEVAVFGLNLACESVLVRGRFSGWRGRGPLGLGSIDVEWVYNSMPPVPGQIYPPLPLTAVQENG